MSNRFRIAVVGGSVAGCAAAVELSRAGHEVTVFERSATALASQGAGIIAPAEVFQGMVARRLLPEDYARCSVTVARYACRDHDQPAGRLSTRTRSRSAVPRSASARPATGCSRPAGRRTSSASSSAPPSGRSSARRRPAAAGACSGPSRPTRRASSRRRWPPRQPRATGGRAALSARTRTSAPTPTRSRASGWSCRS
jgi:glycine/D-amino acid oxidase-like deaminating enzyme